MSVAGVRRDPNPPYPASIHTVPYSTQLLCIYTIPFHTAYPAHYTPGSGPPVTNRTQQATNITIEDRWQGLRRKTHKIPHCSRGGERNRGGHVHLPSCPHLPRPLNAPNSSRINHNTAQLYNAAVQCIDHNISSALYLADVLRQRRRKGVKSCDERATQWKPDETYSTSAFSDSPPIATGSVYF